MAKSKTKSIVMLSLSIGALIGATVATLAAAKTVNSQNLMVTCIEHVTVDGDSECSLFKWRGEFYATEHAPTYPDLRGMQE